MPSVSESIFHGVVEQLAPMVITWETILREHQRTPGGGHCAARTCGRPGYGTPDWQVHPCGVRALAECARTRHRQSSGGSPSSANSSGPKVVTSAISPSATRSTSILNGRNAVSPGRRR
jgi:hypothetical protein